MKYFPCLFFLLLSNAPACRGQSDAVDTTTTIYITYGPEYSFGDDRLRDDMLKGVTAEFPKNLGTIELSFVVNKNGTVRDPIIVTNISAELRIQLAASICKLKKFTPAKKGLFPVNYRMVIWLTIPKQ